MRLALLLITALPVLARAQAMSSDTEAAKAHFAAASAYYDQGLFKDAVREFIEAHRLSQRADLLYNIAVCYEKLGDWDHAIDALRRYLADKPEAPDRATVQSRIGSLERHRSDEASVGNITAPAARATPAPAPPSKPRHLASYVVGGLGLAMLAASIGTGAAALQLDHDLGARCMGGVCAPADRDEASRGRALAISTDVLIGVGAAAMVVAVALFVLEHKRMRRVEGLAVRF